MASVTAAAPPIEAESTRPDADQLNGRIVVIHLIAAQALWLIGIGFGVYFGVSTLT